MRRYCPIGTGRNELSLYIFIEKMIEPSIDSVVEPFLNYGFTDIFIIRFYDVDIVHHIDRIEIFIPSIKNKGADLLLNFLNGILPGDYITLLHYIFLQNDYLKVRSNDRI